MTEVLSPMQEAKRRFGGECDPNKRTMMLLDRLEVVEKVMCALGKRTAAEPMAEPAKLSVAERMKKAREAKKK